MSLLRLIVWLTKLPEDWELRFAERVGKFEETEKVMSIDSLLLPTEIRAEERGLKAGRKQGREQGREQGLQEAIVDALKFRFDTVHESIRKQVRELKNLDRLRQAHRVALTAESLESFSIHGILR